MTSPSDFKASAARVSEGFCPLCEVQLTRVGQPDRSVEHDDGICEPCALTWSFTFVDGRPFLRTSRGLSREEIQKLYDREGGGS